MNKNSYYNLELDKVPGFWVLTAFLSDQPSISLRLKVSYEALDCEADFIAEVRLGVGPFQSIQEWTASMEPRSPDGRCPEVLETIPPVWAVEFTKLIEAFIGIANTVQLGTVSRPAHPLTMGAADVGKI